MTKEGHNKMIAIFIGLQLDSMGFIKYNPTNIKIKVDHDLKFHTSWDWLMPVVEKIESLGYIVSLTNKACHILMNGKTLFDKPMQFISSTKIEATYNAVIEFINWYNSNTPTP